MSSCVKSVLTIILINTLIFFQKILENALLNVPWESQFLQILKTYIEQPDVHIQHTSGLNAELRTNLDFIILFNICMHVATYAKK